ncbi:MAG TPA: hypothetical protein VNZ66_00030 [Aeromicrobium sp.]|nr:hypothetical protein [Aeromicrobium sp.]
MSPRRHSRRPEPEPRGFSRRIDRVETRSGRQWRVRELRSAEKEYRCPGCQQSVRIGATHVLVWPVDRPLIGAEAIDERRHWHTACWSRFSPP